MISATLVLLLAASLRIGWPQLTEFKFSEARMEALALEITREGRLPLVGVPSSAGLDHSPMSIYLYAPAFLQTNHPVPATVYGAVAGLVAVAMCFRFGRQWPGGGSTGGFTSALIAAASPWAVLFSRKIWQISLVPVLALVFAGLAVAGFVSRRRWALCGCVIVYAVLAQVHPSAISLAPVLLLWLALFWRKELLLPLAVGAALGFGTAIPFVIHQAQTGWSVLNSLAQGLGSATWDLSAVRLAWLTITGQGIEALAGMSRPQLRAVPSISPIFAAIGWFVLASAVALGWRAFTALRSKTNPETLRIVRVDIMLVSWLAIPILANLRHSLDLQIHFFALVLPPAFLVVGRALQAVTSGQLRLNRPYMRFSLALTSLSGGTLVAVAATQVVSLILMGCFIARHDTAGGFGRPLGSYLELTDEVVERARSAQASEVLIAGQGSSPVVDEVPAILDVLLRQRIAYRFVDSRMSAVFPMHKSIVLETPERGASASWYSLWPESALADGFGLRVGDGSWPQPAMQFIQAPRLLQNGVELQAYSWSRTAKDCTLRLLWQVLWKTEPDSHFFVHLLDADANLAGQRDLPGVPSEYRRVGDRVLTAFDISSGCSDTSPLFAIVGMYTYPELDRIPIIDLAGIAVAGEVRLGPLQAESGAQQP
ncbi:MAG TPA: hypothetical protein PKO09_15515 [Anaerolineae bacterium]|nr:hypothetical protein [Anaerolineae bacterium]